MIKLSEGRMAFLLKLISGNCLRQGLFPEKCKTANVVPVHKKNEKNLKENNRPISFLVIFCKILEKLVFDTLYQRLESKSLLNPSQSSFHPGASTVNQLLFVVNLISRAFDCNPALGVCFVYLDISKAFDGVWHEGLLYKLRRNGISGRLLLLIESLVANKKLQSVLNAK